ncbi:MAG TPA: endo-alpha-N-acetylgalactosaminidase family protein [Fimbriimonadaceae bacterium]|nr:endo-alpha-N-acetylgalactosaminidase family protein [Fimbriimonadaceae bacterium]
MSSDVLRSASLEVRFLPGQHAISHYRSTRGQSLAAPKERLAILVHNRSTGQYVESSIAGIEIGEEPHALTFSLAVSAEGAAAAKLGLRFDLEDDGLAISSEILSEAEPFEVASVYLPLFQVGEEPGTFLVLPTRSGRLIGLSCAKPERAVHKVNWFEPAPVAIAGHKRMLGVLTLDTVDCQFIHEVADEPRIGTITVELLHRHRCERPEISFLAQRIASCKVRFVAGDDLDWTAGAAVVRDTIPENLSDLYTNSLVYKVLLQHAGAKEVMTYADVLSLIRRVEKLTGGIRQIVYLVGWQHSGHDTGYPDVYTANPRVGTFEEFRALKEAAKSENAIVSLHDNYHDEYMDSPGWDPAIACVDPDGELRKGGIWGGGQAYEIGPSKYALRCLPRAEWTVKTLDLEVTTHLDVLSDKPDMVDFDPAGPASREQNAVAKRAIVETFRRMGVDVTSEVLTSPFAPFMHHFWHVERRPVEGWGPDERVPLVPFLYHGKVTAGGDASTDAGKLDQIEYGWTFSTDWSASTPDSEIAELFYLVWIPWSLLCRREIVGFVRDGDWEKVVFAGESASPSYTSVNRRTSSYEVVVDGLPVARNFATFAPIGDGEWVVYSRSGGEIRIPIPAADARFTPLPAADPLVIAGGKETAFVAEAGVPYRVSC